MEEAGAEPGALPGGDRHDLDQIVLGIERYLTCGSLIFKSFGIPERRSLFWWSLHKLLEEPQSAVTLKELRLFLANTRIKAVSVHLVKSLLVAMQSKHYVSLVNDDVAENNGDVAETDGDVAEISEGDRAELRAPQINNNTKIKIEPALYEAFERYAALFKEKFADGRTIEGDAKAIYIAVNGFLRGNYMREWDRVITQIAEFSHDRLGGRAVSRIEIGLRNYPNQWAVIQFLLRHSLQSRAEETSPFLNFDLILSGVHGWIHVPVRDLERILKFLRLDAKLIQFRKAAGRAEYALAEPVEQMLLDFARTAGLEMESFLNRRFPPRSGRGS
jgi:hypothetical protein